MALRTRANLAITQGQITTSISTLRVFRHHSNRISGSAIGKDVAATRSSHHLLDSADVTLRADGIPVNAPDGFGTA